MEEFAAHPGTTSLRLTTRPRSEELAGWFRNTSDAPEAASLLGECTGLLHRPADLEEAAWRRLAI